MGQPLINTDEEVTDSDLHRHIKAALADYPNLAAWGPSSFPEDPRFDVTLSRLREYVKTREDAYWHQLNLLLVLHNLLVNADARNRSLMNSVLQTLDDFIDRLGHLPGARDELEPLWCDLWTPQPRLWSIAACAYASLCFQSEGIEIVGFGRPGALIGDGPKDADMKLLLGGQETYFEVEAWHRPQLAGKSNDELRAILMKRAKQKAADKFQSIPRNAVGVVAEVCVLRDGDVDRSLPREVAPLPSAGPNVRWMPLKLVGVTHPDGLRYAILPL